MQKDTLLALIYQPENLLETHLEELEEIVQKYPYFHIPHTLIAKLLHDRQSSLAPQKIRRASLYVYNRAILKQFILENPKKIDVEEEFNYQKPQRNLLADIQQEINDFEKKMQNSSVEDLEKELSSITESYLPKNYLLEEKAEIENLQQIEQTDTQKEQNSLIDDFLNSLNKVSDTIDDEQTEETAIKLFEQGNTQAAIAIYEQLKLKHPEKAQYYQSQIDIFSMDFSNTSTITITQKLQETEQKIQETTAEQTNTTPNSFDANSADKSEEIAPEITEAQAIEYFNQGNVAKAIEIYRQLMLQNPDKKAYFASQIEILES